MSTSGSSGSSRGRLPNTEALLATTPGSSSNSSSSSRSSVQPLSTGSLSSNSSSSSRRSVQPLSTGSLSSTGTSTSSTGSVLPNTMKLLRVPATLVSPRPRSPGSPRRSRSPNSMKLLRNKMKLLGSPRRRSPRARSSSSPRRSRSPRSPSSSSLRSPSSSSGWSSAPPVFRRLNFTIKKNFQIFLGFL